MFLDNGNSLHHDETVLPTRIPACIFDTLKSRLEILLEVLTIMNTELKRKTQWEAIDSNFGQMRRLPVPGGWLVFVYFSFYERYGGNIKDSGSGMTFYPDPDHEWNRPQRSKAKCSRLRAFPKR